MVVRYDPRGRQIAVAQHRLRVSVAPMTVPNVQTPASSCLNNWTQRVGVSSSMSLIRYPSRSEIVSRNSLASPSVAKAANPFSRNCCKSDRPEAWAGCCIILSASRISLRSRDARWLVIRQHRR